MGEKFFIMLSFLVSASVTDNSEFALIIYLLNVN